MALMDQIGCIPEETANGPSWARLAACALHVYQPFADEAWPVGQTCQGGELHPATTLTKPKVVLGRRCLLNTQVASKTERPGPLGTRAWPQSIAVPGMQSALALRMKRC